VRPDEPLFSSAMPYSGPPSFVLYSPSLPDLGSSALPPIHFCSSALPPMGGALFLLFVRHVTFLARSVALWRSPLSPDVALVLGALLRLSFLSSTVWEILPPSHFRYPLFFAFPIFHRFFLSTAPQSDQKGLILFLVADSVLGC